MNIEENNTIAPRKSVNLNICGGNHKLVEIEEVTLVPTPPVEYRKKENALGERNVSYLSLIHI